MVTHDKSLHDTTLLKGKHTLYRFALRCCVVERSCECCFAQVSYGGVMSAVSQPNFLKHSLALHI